MQKLIIVIGVLIILIGIFLPWIMKSGLGKLPGDFLFKRGNFTFYFPLATCLVISLIITFLMWLMNR